MGRIRIVLADDHAMLRELLRPVLDAQPDMEVIAEADTAAATLKVCRQINANVIVLDIALPDRSGISLLPELRQHCPSTRVLVLSFHDEVEYMRSAFAAGAIGYVVKSSKLSVLLDGIRAVNRGENFIDPSLRQHTVELAKPVRSVEAAPASRLSVREEQVLRGLAHGMSYQAIATKIGISVKTVETYRSRLTTKLGFQSRADLMRFAIEAGMLEDESK